MSSLALPELEACLDGRKLILLSLAEALPHVSIGGVGDF